MGVLYRVLPPDRWRLLVEVEVHRDGQRGARQSAMGRVSKKYERLKVAQGTKDNAYCTVCIQPEYGLVSHGFNYWNPKASRLIPGLE